MKQRQSFACGGVALELNALAGRAAIGSVQTYQSWRSVPGTQRLAASLLARQVFLFNFLFVHFL
jgi:hypothetical protein